MAYLDLECRNLGAGASGPSLCPDIPGDARGREADEWALHRQVIELSLRDGLKSVGTPTRIQRMAAALFGFSCQNQLADRRLEALRRFAVIYRLRGAELALAEKQRMLAIGFTDQAVSRFSRHIDRSVRGGSRGLRRMAPTLTSVAMLVATAAFTAWLCDPLDQPLITLVFAGLVVVTLEALLGGSINNVTRR